MRLPFERLVMARKDMETHIATRKPHRCHLCGRKIPIGSRYFTEKGGERREHTNCMDFKDQPLLDPWFNADRKRGEVDYTPPEKVDGYGRLKDEP